MIGARPTWHLRLAAAIFVLNGAHAVYWATSCVIRRLWVGVWVFLTLILLNFGTALAFRIVAKRREGHGHDPEGS